MNKLLILLVLLVGCAAPKTYKQKMATCMQNFITSNYGCMPAGIDGTYCPTLGAYHDSCREHILEGDEQYY